MVLATALRVVRDKSFWQLVARQAVGRRVQLLPRLRFAEKPAGVNIAGKAAGRDSTQIINASRIRAVVKPRGSSPARVGIAAWRWRTITCSLILLNGCAGQCARCGSRGCAD